MIRLLFLWLILGTAINSDGSTSFQPKGGTTLRRRWALSEEEARRMREEAAERASL